MNFHAREERLLIIFVSVISGTLYVVWVALRIYTYIIDLYALCFFALGNVSGTCTS
jgi:hypothetical protein